jgi:hypothetical protein
MTKLIRLIVFALCFATSLGPARLSAQQDTVAQRFTNAANNLSHKLLICSSFFYITAIGMMNRNDAKGQKDGEQQKQVGDQLSTVAGRLGEIIGQKPAAFQARLEMAMADLRKEMADNYVNYSILQQKYLDSCTDLAGNLRSRIEALKEAAQ